MKCPICNEKIFKKDIFISLSCKCPYIYHKICINSWLSISNSCTNCRHKWKKNPFITYYKKSYLEELEKRLFYESIGLQINNYLIQ